MIPLTVLPHENGSRRSRDRLELLTALISAPGFDPLYRADYIEIPRDHPAYGWGCQVADCGRPRKINTPLCHNHQDEWTAAKAAGRSRADFLGAAAPLTAVYGKFPGYCLACKERPAIGFAQQLCHNHTDAWRRQISYADFERWLQAQPSRAGLGECSCVVCPEPASNARWKLCYPHYQRLFQPAGVKQAPDEVKAAVSRFRREAEPVYRFDVINMRGLPPLVRAELQWGLYAHAQVRYARYWDIASVQRLINTCRQFGYLSMADLAEHDYRSSDSTIKANKFSTRRISTEINRSLQLIYHSPADTKEAGYIETEHFGRRFARSGSTFDLTSVPQRWLRDLVWDRFADMLGSTNCPRTRGVFDQMRRTTTEFGAFLELEAPGGGHDPRLLTEAHAQRFVTDQRHRERHQLPPLAKLVSDRGSPVVTTAIRRAVFNRTRGLLFWAVETGRATEIGFDAAFAAAIPQGGPDAKTSRNPFSDNVAQALADEANLRLLQTYDPNDLGLRDIWEAIVLTGRRCREITELRLDCVGRYGGLPLLWHDQTKVGNLNEGIRIPEPLYLRIEARQNKTIIRFEHRRGRLPTAEERTALALFPSKVANSDLTRAVSYTFFRKPFKDWVESLELPKSVAHQARHTLATKLLRAGANLAHIRRYLGQVSDRMAERYVKVAHSDLEDILNSVWVAGPSAAVPGELLSGTTAPLTRDEALTLAVDLSRRSTPAEGGFCTFQPVVNGNACPWNLDCHNCDKFVMSGADLLYWRRKQEQWRSIAERAPDDATADYLHQVFEPTARAITGLEKALAGLGLLEEALQMDLRRPQDYFHRIWATNFRATALASLEPTADDDALEPQ